MSMFKFIPPPVGITSDTGIYETKCPFCGGIFTYTSDQFTCWTCNATGCTADFLAMKNKIPLPQAEWALDKRIEDKEALEALESICAIYQKALNKTHPYLIKRGVTEDIINKYRLGWADGKLTEKISDKTRTALQRIGIIKPDGTELFRNRIMIPIMNKNSKVVGFGARQLYASATYSSPKYLNSPDSAVFSKKNLLFGLNNINPKEPVYLVEGYFDVITAQNAGINAVACLGTAVGPGHIHLLKSMRVKEIIIALDSDGPGVKNAVKAANLMKNEFTVKCLPSLPQGKDPDEFIKKNGGKAFMQLEPISARDFLIRQGLNPLDVL